MKLRNKITGEIIESACIGVFKHQSSGDCERVDTEARSLEKVLEVWEDYKPAEPLIKDEKVRKAFRAWAETLGDHGDTYKYDAERFSFNSHIADSTIEFAKTADIKCEDRQLYTLKELCGDD